VREIIRSSAAIATLVLVFGTARAEDDGPELVVPVASVPPHAGLTPPAMLLPASPRAWSVSLESRSPEARRHPLHLSLDLSMSYLRLAVHGDHRAGLAPFLGTSTAALGGLRLRF
jgi:hypothetical protein